MRAPISVAIPTIPPRAVGGTSASEAYEVPGIPYVRGGGLLQQAVYSAQHQTVEPRAIHVALDNEKKGAADTRQRALDMVDSEYVSFLDDDDLMYPHHLETHWALLRETGADVAYSWFDGNEPFPASSHRGKVWDPAGPHHITMTITVRTELAKQVGFAPHPDAREDGAFEDWRFILGLNELGAKFIGTGLLTWHYRVWRGNTSGLATRW